jgi:PhoH-like ATPase
MSVPNELKPKMYVLDTNVLLHDPRSLFSFHGALVGIPIMVLEELEKFKRETSGRGKNARESVRYLDQLREQGNLSDGVAMEGGGMLRVLFTPEHALPNFPLDTGIMDNKILMTAAACVHDYDVRFISKDLNARVKADVIGLPAEDYLKGYVPQDEFYKGWVKVQVPSVQLKQEIPDALKEMVKANPFIINEYILVESQHNPFNYRVFRYVGGQRQFIAVNHPKLTWPIEARNPQQLMALDALLDPSLDFVTLIGPAGTGKTFIALLAGLYEVLASEVYTKLLVSRPVIPLGPDIGYLPGDVQEKLHTWMQPIFDNLEVIIQAVNKSRHNQHQMQEEVEEQGNGNGHKKDKKHRGKEKKSFYGTVNDLIHHDKLSLEAITYMRGRSIPYQFILFDEVQNLSPHEVKTLISRVGQGSKIVFCGDPSQIDSPYLDFSSNGLVIASDKFKGQSLFATVYLETSERSVLSSLVSELL